MLMTVLLSVSLSLDAFAVAVAHGLKATKIPMVSKLIICLISILYFGAAVWMGDRIASFLSPQTTKIIGIILMCGICLWMLLQVLFGKNKKGKNKKKSKTLFQVSLKSIGLTFNIIRNPMLSDINESKRIDPIEALFLGTALSIDSISVGIGYSLLGDVSFLAPFMVGLIQFSFLCIGNWIGLKFTSLKHKNSDYLQIISVAVMFVLILIRIFV